MKRFLLFFISVFIYLNIYGQDTYTGRIIRMPNPCPPSDSPCLPGGVFGLETTSGKYVLSIDLYWIWSYRLIFKGTEYFIDDEVEITGIVSVWLDMFSKEYFVLEIETIKKLSSSLESLSSNKNKIYVDAIKQVIVIDETLQNQSLTFELVDLQGNIIWEETNVGKSISVANLPGGIYLCRIWQNGRIIYSDKILRR